jgi:hypothetical protein
MIKVAFLSNLEVICYCFEKEDFKKSSLRQRSGGSWFKARLGKS